MKTSPATSQRTRHSHHHCARLIRAAVFAWLSNLAAVAHGQIITLDRPGDREFVVDRADLIATADEQAIRSLADRLLTDTGSPIIVVTIESMGNYNARGISAIESFTKVLFDQWGIGQLTIDSQPANTGILLIVSRDDRKARIELGIGWDYEKEAAAQQIMNNIIVPRFKGGDFTGGILAGVQALEQLARGGTASHSGAAPAPGASPGGGESIIGCGGGGLAIAVVLFVVISRVLRGTMGGMGARRSGYSGFLPGMMAGRMLGGMSGRSGGFSGGGGYSGSGGFRGGSFGGGFSGGRGASGSW